MTITTTAVRNDFVSSGQTTFTYTFKIFAATDIVVQVNSITKTLTTDYTVTGVGSASGGTVVFGTATTAGQAISLTRVLPYTRTADYQPSGQFSATTVNTEFDKIWAKLEEVNAAETRSIQLLTSDPVAATLTLPLVANRANGVLSFDASGNVTVSQIMGSYRSTWATATLYNLRDVVKDVTTTSIYYCTAAHTSGTWATDLAAGKWSLVIDASAVATSAASATAAANSATTATTQAGNASSSAAAALTSQNAAAGSSTTASGFSSAASTSATNAATSATNANTSAVNANNSAISAAASAAASTAGTKASATDTTIGVLNTKLIPGTDLTLTLNNAGSNESLTLTANANIARLATAQSFSANQNFTSAQIASNYLSPYAPRNKFINPTMSIDQANEFASVTLTSGAPVFMADQWIVQFNQTGAAGTTSTQTVADAPTALPGGKSLKFTIGTGTALSTGDSARIMQDIEAFNTTDLAFGTAGASAISVSFWIKTSLTGPTFTFAIQNSAQTRSYITSYTVPTANTWTKITIPNIPGDTTGTWVTETNGYGLITMFGFGVGSAKQGVTGWQAGNLFGLSTGTNLMATTGATVQITGLQLEPGAVCTPLERRPYAQELVLCQRYYEKSYDIGTAPGTVTINGESWIYLTNLTGSVATGGAIVPFKVTKRAAPTMAFYSVTTGAVGKVRDSSDAVDVTPTLRQAGLQNFGWFGTNTAVTTAVNFEAQWTADARL